MSWLAPATIRGADAQRFVNLGLAERQIAGLVVRENLNTAEAGNLGLTDGEEDAIVSTLRRVTTYDVP